MTTSNIPKQVQDAADEAERLEKSLQPQDPPSDPPPGTPDPAVVQPPAQPAPAPVEAVRQEEDWRQRYLSLQGMYNAEIPRMAAQMKEQAALIASLQAAQTQAQPSAPQAPKPKLVTDKDVEVFGGDLLDLIKRQSGDIVQQERERFSGELVKLQNENAELKKQLGGVVETQGVTRRQSYLNDLARQVPDYETLNVDPELLKWMAETDPLSGLQRQAYLNNAWEQFDVTRTANLFKAFKTAHGRGEPVAPAAPQVQSAQQELARQVAPGTQRASQPAADTGTDRIWTRAEVERFYTDVTKGLYASKPKELQRIESEIDQAVAKGLVR